MPPGTRVSGPLQLDCALFSPDQRVLHYRGVLLITGYFSVLQNTLVSQSIFMEKDTSMETFKLVSLQWISEERDKYI